MIAIPELKLNRFAPAFLPKPRELFARYGYNKHAAKGMTGDDTVKVNPSKIDTLNEIMRQADAD